VRTAAEDCRLWLGQSLVEHRLAIQSGVIMEFSVLDLCDRGLLSAMLSHLAAFHLTRLALPEANALL
jgi:hypothetical protein